MMQTPTPGIHMTAAGKDKWFCSQRTENLLSNLNASFTVIYSAARSKQASKHILYMFTSERQVQNEKTIHEKKPKYILKSKTRIVKHTPLIVFVIISRDKIKCFVDKKYTDWTN